MTLLIVDDNPTNLKLLRAQLEADGHAVLEAGNGIEALAILNREPVDAIVSDILMPKMDGYRLCYEVRQSTKLRQIPLVIYTATYTSPSDEKLCYELGADKYIRKPAATAVITAALREAVDSEARHHPRPSTALDLNAADVMKEYSERLVTKLEQKNVELLLQATAVASSANAIVITDANGGILWVNPAFTALTGYSAEEVSGKTPRLLKSGRHDAAFYSDLWGAILAGQTWRGEVTNRRKDGSLYHGEQTITPVRAQGGPITHFIGIMNDVTERRRAEEELRRAHEQLQHLLEHSPAVIYSHKVEEERVIPQLVSDNITRLLGFTVEESCSFDWWASHLHPDDRERVLASISETLKGGASTDEYRVRHKDGHYVWVEDNRRVMHGAVGKPVEIAGVWTDITGRKRAEDQLREQASLLDKARDAILVRDLEHRITYWNKSAERLYGWTADEALGRSAAELLYKDPSSFQDAYKRVMETGEWVGELEQLGKDGQERIVEGRWTLVRAADGQPRAILSINTDVTEKKQLAALLLRAQRLESIGTLAGGVAHDLNNALSPILMGIQLLRMRYPDETEMIDTMEASTKRGADMVRQLLTFAKGAKGERVLVQPRHLLKEMDKIIKVSFPKNIFTRISFTKECRTVLGDATQLHQVLLNLCVNARDAMPNGGMLTLDADNVEIDAAYASAVPNAKPGSYVVCRVTDTGTGIPPEVLERIFEPFFSTKGPDKGTGLGLSTVIGIVKGHGGFVQVYSVPGEGSTFAVYLPADHPAVEDTGMTVKSDITFRGNGEIILVVDDELPVCEVLRTVLTSLNFKVVTASDGTEALMQVADRRGDLRAVITDLHMPQMDGLTFVRVLKHMLPAAGVIVTSGHVDDREANEFKSLGVNAILHKPFTEQTLVAALQKVFVS